MPEFKAVDHITDNGKHILIYEYLDFPITIMLANDIVVGINPEADSVSFMIPNKDYVYEPITDIHSTKPTLGAVEMEVTANNLQSLHQYSNGEFIKNEYFKDKILSVILKYWNR